MVCGLAVLLVDRRARHGPAEAATGRTPPAGHPQHPGEHPERPDRAAGLRRHRPAVPAPAWPPSTSSASDAWGRETTERHPSRCTRRSGRSRSWLSSSRSWSRRSSPSPTCSTTPREARARRGRERPTTSRRSTRSSGCGATSSRRHTPRWCTPRPRRASTSYLRTTVLDRFTDDEWRPSPRALPSEQPGRRRLPEPARPGRRRDRRPRTPGRFEFAPNFSTTWLPLPYPIRKLDDRGHLALRRAHPRRGLRRRRAAAGAGVRAPPRSRPSVTAQLLDVRGRAAARPGSQAPMTAVPDDPPRRDQRPGHGR